MKKIVLSLLIISSSISCQEEDVLDNSPSFNNQEFLKSSESSKISDEVTAIIIEDYEESYSDRHAVPSNPYLPECVTRTITSEGDNHSIELDFGTTGCEMPNGNIITGILIYTYQGALSANSKTITYNFNNFSFNNKQVEGTDTILHVRDNGNGNPQSTINVNLIITWSDGVVGIRTGTLVREWTEGYNTILDWTDDVFQVDGNWQTEFDNGNIYRAEITSTLTRKLSCIHFVSGVISFDYSGLLFTCDYGNGECDNSATITLANGISFTIDL